MQENKVFHHYYINNCIGSMIRGIADYFGTEFFDRTKEIVISTYEKGVQHWIQRQQNAGEKMSPKYPFVVFDPGLDFEPDPQAGRFFWGYPNFMGNFASKMFRPAIYEDENLLIAPILNRYKGRFDIIVWCSSVYELIDFRMLTFQMFAGQDRIITPVNIEGYIVLPDELLAYTYENPYTGESYSIDWSANRSEVVLVKNINKNRMVYPFEITPWIKLISCDDGSEKYGGSGDEISDHRLTLSCEWECSIPTHLGLVATKQPLHSTKPINPLTRKDIKIGWDIDVGYQYSVSFRDPDSGSQIGDKVPLADKIIHTFVGQDMTTGDDGEFAKSYWSEMASYKDRYNYLITQDDYDKAHADPPENFVVNLIDDIEDPYNLRIYGKFGPLMRDYHWKITSPGVVEFIGFNLGALNVGDNLWFAIYEVEE